MINTAVILALLTTAGFLVIYARLPPGIKKIIKKYPLITDAFALLGIYVLLGGTLTALLAAAISGLIISVLLYASGDNQDFNSIKSIMTTCFSKIPFLRKISF